MEPTRVFSLACLLMNICPVYMRAVGGEVGATSSLAPKLGPLGLSPKKVGDDIAKVCTPHSGGGPCLFVGHALGREAGICSVCVLGEVVVCQEEEEEQQVESCTLVVVSLIACLLACFGVVIDILV